MFIALLGAAHPLYATESTPDSPQLNTPANPVTIVLDHNRQFLTIDQNNPMNKIYHDGNRDFYGLLGILTIIALAYCLVEHETKKSNYCHQTAEQNKICQQCQCKNNQPE